MTKIHLPGCNLLQGCAPGCDAAKSFVLPERLVPEQPSEPTWVDGAVPAIDWLLEYKGPVGQMFAEEMYTRLPGAESTPPPWASLHPNPSRWP